MGCFWSLIAVPSFLCEVPFITPQLKLQEKLPPTWDGCAAAFGGVLPSMPRSRPSLAARAFLAVGGHVRLT